MSDNLILAGAALIVSICGVIGLGLVVLGAVLRTRNRHRGRLARVGRTRLSGRLDLEDARLMLLRQKHQANLVEVLTGWLARVVPLLDTTRLNARFTQAALGWSITTFMLVSLAVGGLLTLAARFATGQSVALVLVPCVFAGMWLVDKVVGLRGDRLANRFMRQLPEGIDTIIRGIRSGVPVIECIGAVGQEYGEPMGGHFRAISERVRLGEPLDAALWRVARVIDKREMDFFATSIAIQAETGGSLSEALGNLGDLLRTRERMRLKISAISSEAKASALIIGVLPFLMLALLMFMSPQYAMKLFTDPRGNLMLLAGLASISCGAFVMWRMTQFEI